MEVISILLAIILPPVCWLGACYWWDRREPEPKALIAKLFFSGIILGLLISAILIVVQAVFVTSGTLIPFNALFEKDSIVSFFVAGLFIAATHAYATLLLARKIVSNEHSFSQVVDGIIYFSTIALGAGLTQNLLFSAGYLFTNKSAEENLAIILFNLIFKSVVLGVSAGIVGFAFGNIYKRALEDGKIEKWELGTTWKNPEILEGLSIAILLHASYQVFIYLDEPRVAGVIVIIGAFYLFTRFSFRNLTVNIRE